MTISFDLDDTLIPGQYRFETAPQRFWHGLSGSEPLRAGAAGLMRQLRSEGHRVFIYTTSMRSSCYIRRMFRLHGVRLDGVVNQQRHEAALGDRRRDHSKYPPAFGIDIHVDDSRGVAMEGLRYGFYTIILSENCTDWRERVLRDIALLQKQKDGQAQSDSSF